LQKNFFPENSTVKTVYLGGGTPSLLDINAIGKILSLLDRTFDLSAAEEITLEVNPEDVSKVFYRQAKAVGINRISIGVQSFDDNILKYLNRRHSSIQAMQSITLALNEAINNISIDLIYGIPILSTKDWEKTLQTLIKFSLSHFSAYHLSIEPQTTFGYLKQKNKIREISEDESWKQFEILHYFAEENNFEHYEISNFAKKGMRSQHNSSYWQDIPYLGLGSSANSYNGLCRYENFRDISTYISMLDENRIPAEISYRTKDEAINETIMVRLRCKEGIFKNEFIAKFGVENYKILEHKAEKYFPEYLGKDNNGIRLNLAGWFISDAIIADLFF
jgi:oxygen-independent coproporphyrinogen-3 oxidase